MFDKELLKEFQIAIDGPSGSGKTTTARLVAQRLGLLHIDTGAMYRALTLAAMNRGVDPAAGDELGRLAASLRMEFVESPDGTRRILMDGEDVSEEIRSPAVTANVSLVSSHERVRKVMAALQRRIADKGGVVLEGRDIGSVILPGADLKIFLVASIEARAKRRMLELRSKGIAKSIEEVEQEIRRRDEFDSTRAVSPLKHPVGAITIDTTDLTIAEQVESVVEKVKIELERLTRLESEGESGVDPRKRRFNFASAQLLIRTFFRLLWRMRVVRLGRYHYKENFIFASNHLSYMDPPLVGSVLPREIHFLAKEELFRNRPFGWLISKYNAIPVRRGGVDRRSLRIALDLLARGKSLLIFPEGTRMKDGRLGEPKTGIGYLALHSRVPVVPVYAVGTNRLLPALFGRPRLTVVMGRPIRLSSSDLEEFKNGKGYADYSAMVMEAIAALRDSLGG